MTEASVPQQGILVGDAIRAPYDADEFALDFMATLTGFGRRANFGVVYGYDNGTNYSLEVTQVAVASSNVELKIGAAIVRGTAYLNDATLTLAIAANASGNARIDTVVLRKDYTAQTIRAVVRQGTPAASPVPPTLTQTASTWEIPIADVAVANGFSTITDSNITPRHEFCNVGNGTFIDGVVNNSGAALVDGDVVIWDSTADRGITTTTTGNNWKVAGVVRGRIAAGARGRIQTGGVGYVKYRLTTLGVQPWSASFGRNLELVTGLFAGYATHVSIRATASSYVGTDGSNAASGGAGGRTGSAPAMIGYSLQSISIVNEPTPTYTTRLLAYIQIQQSRNPHSTIFKRAGTADVGTFTSGSWITAVFNRVSHGAELDTAIGANNNANNYVSYNTANDRITIQPGRYFIKAWSSGYRVDGHLIRLQDITNAATVVVSSPAYSPSAADSTQSYPELETVLIVESATVYEIQKRCTTTRATDGLGKYVSFSSESVCFNYLEITRYDEVYT